MHVCVCVCVCVSDVCARVLTCRRACERACSYSVCIRIRHRLHPSGVLRVLTQVARDHKRGFRGKDGRVGGQRGTNATGDRWMGERWLGTYEARRGERDVEVGALHAVAADGREEELQEVDRNVPGRARRIKWDSRRIQWEWDPAILSGIPARSVALY
jgi:hypothetical protein